MRSLARKIFKLFLNKKLATMWFLGAAAYTPSEDLDYWASVFAQVFRGSALLWSMMVLVFT